MHPDSPQDDASGLSRRAVPTGGGRAAPAPAHVITPPRRSRHSSSARSEAGWRPGRAPHGPSCSPQPVVRGGLRGLPCGPWTPPIRGVSWPRIRAALIRLHSAGACPLPVVVARVEPGPRAGWGARRSGRHRPPPVQGSGPAAPRFMWLVACPRRGRGCDSVAAVAPRKGSGRRACREQSVTGAERVGKQSVKVNLKVKVAL